MDINTAISFFRLLRTNPKLAHDKKAFTKFVNKAADETFKYRKAIIHNDITNQKKELLTCFEMYEKYVEETGFNPVCSNEEETRAFIEEFVIRLGIQNKGENDANENRDPQTTL